MKIRPNATLTILVLELAAAASAIAAATPFMQCGRNSIAVPTAGESRFFRTALTKVRERPALVH